MPAKKKKFIDKKNAVTFHLVHRSQKDPLQADDDAPQRVLMPFDSDQDAPEKRLEEQRKFGIFFDDEYDYLQHLRDVRELNEVEPVAPRAVKPSQPEDDKASNKGMNINLPSSVFGSTVETDVGMLNKAAPISGPRLDWDPDIVAALDEDFDFDDPDNQLDDDFVIKANDDDGMGEDCGEDQDEDYEYDKEDESEVYKPFKPKQGDLKPDEDDVASDGADLSSDEDEGSDFGSLGDRSFGDMDTKSRFTNYSMTSSVIRRTEGLTLLDDRFEKLYEQYDDNEIGALDHEDIGGNVPPSSQVLEAVMEEFEIQHAQQKLKDAVQTESMTLDYSSDDDEDGEDDLVKMVIEEPKEKWDCESILSTYSTLYNHPKTISEPKKSAAIKLTKRAGIPEDSLPARGLTRKQIEQLTAPPNIVDHANTYRPKNESTEERRQRKQAVKDERKVRREEKKSNKLSFKAEKIRQEKEHLNVKQNFQGATIT